jgi:hypothetical protein
MLERRNFLIGATALIFAPAVVRAQSLMPVKIWKTPLIKIGDNLLCNGAEVNVNEYPYLFSALGNTYGGSDNKFNLPDFSQQNLQSDRWINWRDSPLVKNRIGYLITPQGMILNSVLN